MYSLLQFFFLTKSYMIKKISFLYADLGARFCVPQKCFNVSPPVSLVKILRIINVWYAVLVAH